MSNIFIASLIITILNTTPLPQKTPRCLVNNRGCGQLCLGESAMSAYHSVRFDPTTIGIKFGRWTVIGASIPLRLTTSSARYAVCECQCGTVKLVRLGSLRAAETKGCIKCSPNKKHGKTKTVEFAVWGRMLRRCYNARSRDYKDYGAKGIGVDPVWRNSFCQFLSDMGQRPSSEHTIDRIDSSKDYGPTNCRWLLSRLQSRNRRCCKRLTVYSKTLTLPEWAEITGDPQHVISGRLRLGWCHKEAVFGRPRSIKA